jgi:AcrR family transcriptional regulator
VARRAQPGEKPADLPIDRIRAAALRIFAERGYHATSVRDITRACGVVPAALYNHFPSKADLLQDLILQGHAELNTLVEHAVQTSGSAPGQRLREVTRGLARFHAEHTALATLSNREFRALPDPHRDVIIQQRRRVRAIVEDILADGVRDGTFHLPEVDGAPALTLTAMSILNSLVHIADWYRPGRELSPRQIGDFYAEWAAASAGTRHEAATEPGQLAQATTAVQAAAAVDGRPSGQITRQPG